MLRLVLSFLCTVISAVFVLALLPIVFLHLLYLKGLYALLRLRLRLRLCTRCGVYLKRKAGIPVDGLDMLALVETLTHHSQVLVCGEAKSHCVNFTMRDLLGAWPAGRAADLVLLQDGTSPVGGCEDAADKFENDMRNAGVTIVKCAEFSPK